MDRPLTTAERAARGQHTAAVPDYAEMATVAIEAITGKPRGTWGAGAVEHKAVTALLRRWAEAREAA